jgi:putative transferase (TIGR04331 family)
LVTCTLITTADERTWPNDQTEPVLFLGQWCKRYSRRDKWEQLDSVFAPYHWDDRQKLFTDYQYLQELYEEILTELSEQLNYSHKTNHSLRYWRILIGPWLGYFVQILFDRWFMLQYAVKQYNVTECHIVKRDLISIVPNDMSHFIEMFVDDDWNEAIYAELLKHCWSDQVNLTPVDSDSAKDYSNNINNSIKKNVKKFTEKVLSKYNKISIKEDEYFFISSYLPLKAELTLQIQLGQFPKIWRRQQQSEKLDSADISKRFFNLGVYKKNDQSFSAVVRRLIALQIPIAYLEGYAKLVEKTQQLPWPKKPKAIFTSNAYSSDDIFKCWSAEKVEAGVPLVIGQHGGNFGMNPFSFHEEHQIKISDQWLSWGWMDSKRSNIIPMGNLKAFSRSIGYDPKGGALMVEMSIPRNSYGLYAIPISNQWLDYLNDQFLFLKSLPKQLRHQVLLRLYANDFGWDQIERWKDEMPDVQLNYGNDNIHSLMRKSRLYISTYNATTYLESLSWNMPTIIFWNIEHWELNEQTKPYFELLKKVGIFHETPQSAAHQMIKVWNDVDSWWSSEEVQNARIKFCEEYAYISKKPIDKLQNFFEKLVSN